MRRGRRQNPRPRRRRACGPLRRRERRTILDPPPMRPPMFRRWLMLKAPPPRRLPMRCQMRDRTADGDLSRKRRFHPRRRADGQNSFSGDWQRSAFYSQNHHSNSSDLRGDAGRSGRADPVRRRRQCAVRYVSTLDAVHVLPAGAAMPGLRRAQHAGGGECGERHARHEGASERRRNVCFLLLPFVPFRSR